MKKLNIWKTSAVGLSTGVSVRCNECGVILSNIPRLEAGAATVFCPHCQKTTMATQFVFLTGEKNPLPTADGDRRFMVMPNAKLTGDPQPHRGASSEQSERG